MCLHVAEAPGTSQGASLLGLKGRRERSLAENLRLTIKPGKTDSRDGKPYNYCAGYVFYGSKASPVQ